MMTFKKHQQQGIIGPEQSEEGEPRPSSLSSLSTGMPPDVEEALGLLPPLGPLAPGSWFLVRLHLARAF
jgi:hypothetical protein